jgi:class 3 adenylate cyclase/tetratricopeptide (TPR) repeat protein
MSDLQDWLKTIGLEEYAEKFAVNRIGADVLCDLTEEDLEKLGIPLGDRKRLLNATALLGGQEGAGTPEAATTFADQVEQRQLTLMFVDLVGSTALSERLDLEEYRAVIKALHETSTAILRDHNGFIAQMQGDGVLAYFGYPQAGEDDAERAVAAGLAIARAVGSIESEPGVSLQARVGIATGLVAVGDLIGEGIAEKWTVTGETPNLAARLQALAVPGAVVANDVTRNLLGNQFVCEYLGLRSLKGFSEPVRVWRVREVQSSNSRFESHHHGHLTPFVGREEEIELFHRRWRNTKAASGQMVLISGEPGIGKSRLAKEFCDQVASEQHTHLRYQCLPNRKDSPFHPIIARLERTIGFAPGDNQTERFGKLETWVRRELQGTPLAVKVFAKLLSVPTNKRFGPLELEPKELKNATFEVLFDQLTALLEKSPVILLFEDLQWIDPTSQDLLDTVIEGISGRQLFLICTCRPEYDAQWIGDASVTYLNLRRLDGRQSAALVERMLGGVGLPPEIEAKILAKTDGVPLFLEELTKTILESGSLRREGGAYKLDPDSDALGVLPTTLRGSLLARLDRLPGVQHVAPLGAAIGRTFNYKLLRQVVDFDEEELQSILSLLLDALLLSRRGFPPDATYRFKHALVQDAAYETLPKGRRRKVHGRIATALTESFPEICASKPEIVADHYARSNAPAEAYDFWRRAAIIARQHSANAEAVAHIKNALIANEHTENADARVSNEIQLREMLYVPLEVTDWGSAEIADNLDKLRKLREARGDAEELLSVLNGICGDHIMGGRVSEARKIARKMLRVKRNNTERVAAVLGNRFLGICDFLSANLAGAVSHLEKTIALCSRVEREEVRKYYYADSVLMSRSYIAWSLVLSGEKARAEDAIKVVTRLTAKEIDAHSKTYALCILASIHQSAGNPGESLKNSSQALELAQEYGLRYWEAWAQIMKGWALAVRGGHNQGIEELKGGIAKYERTGSRQMLPYAHTLLADAYCSAGDGVEGLEIIRDLENDPEFREIRYIDALTVTIRDRASVAASAVSKSLSGGNVRKD